MPDLYGPIFDHEVEGYVAFIGTVHDATASKSGLDVFGPISDKIVAEIPPELDIKIPPVAGPAPVRNRLEPRLVEFLSPSVYPLEKDPKTGQITGFKF